MKLKRMWPAVCIWAVFIIFDVIMVASSSFFSGLFPSTNKLIYAVIFTIISTALIGILTYMCGKICDYFRLTDQAETVRAKILYLVLTILVIVGGIVDRVGVLKNTTYDPSGKLSLYSNAMIGVMPSEEYDLLSVIYSALLKIVLIFTGNKQIVAFYFSIALFTAFIICGTIVTAMLLGKGASLTFAAFTSFMPVFSDKLYKNMLTTDELFYAMFGVELLVLSIFLSFSYHQIDKSAGWAVFYAVTGAVVGFMTYLDAGSGVVVLPLILSVIFLLESEYSKNFFRLIFVLLGGIVTFFVMILQEGGISSFDVVLSKWGSYFFHNLNTFNTFWTYTNYKIIYLVTFVCMLGVMVGYWRNRYFERVSPWLLSTIIIFFITPFFGATRMNDERVLTFYFAFVLGCVVSLIVTDKKEESMVTYAEISDVDKEEQEIREIAEYDSEKRVVKPETSGKDKFEDNNLESESLEENHIEKNNIEANNIIKNNVTPENHVNAEKKETANTEKIRFVPEGMVLPTGSEDEMDTDKAKMRMPKFEGKLSLDRPEKKVHKQEKIKKDDFDIPFREGDDFDI